uniref:BTB domain-containing protein n=1 Tax=Heterorhabditis bacteriophora TaxID=37862 RepID=A0A1I7XP95_HETBA
MDGWCAESDSLPFVRPIRAGRVSPESRNKKSHHYVNDRLSGEFFHNLTSLRRCDQLCDVVLEACGNSETGAESEHGPPIVIAAHRVVLAATSPYFRAMFTCQMLESVTDRIVLKEIDGGTLSILVDYMYSGRLDIDENNVQSLLTTASILQLACVRDACSRFLLEQLDVSNCLGIATFAHLHNCTQLAHAAQVFTQQHFRPAFFSRDLIASEEMLTMEEDHFFQLIDDDRLTTKAFLFLFLLCTPVSPLPQRRCRCGIAMAGDLVYAIGGFNGSARVRSVDIYDPRRYSVSSAGNQCRIWEYVGEMQEWSLQMISFLFALGGDDGASNLSSVECIELEESSSQWNILQVNMLKERISVIMYKILYFRESVYLEGGVQFITSRILLVDLLTERIPINNVAGILVYRAHQYVLMLLLFYFIFLLTLYYRVLSSFQESFILRLYRERKRGGIVKAFSDVPTALSAFGQLQRLVDRLYVKRVRLIPRFDVDVKTTLNKTPPAISELIVDVPPRLRRIHSTLAELLKVCIRELKQCSTIGKQTIQEEDTVNLAVYGITQLERQLLEKRSFLSEKQSRLIFDLSLLRELLQIAEDMDPATLLNRINVLRKDKEVDFGYSSF